LTLKLLQHFYNGQQSHCHMSQYAGLLLVTDSRDRRDWPRH